MLERRSEIHRWLIRIALLLGLGLIVYLLRDILIPFVIAAGLTFILGPVALWLEKRLHLPRLIIVIFVFIFVFGPLAGLGYIYGPAVLKNTEELISKIPQMVEQVASQLFGRQEITVLGTTMKINDISRQVLDNMRTAIGASEQGGARLARLALGFAAGVVLTLVAFFYFLFIYGSFMQGIIGFIHPGKRPRIKNFLKKVNQLLGRYLRGLFLIVIIAMSTAAIGLNFFFHLPYGVPIAILTGFCELLPVIGPVAAWGIAAMAAFVHGGVWEMTWVIILYGLMRLVLDDFIGPYVLGRAVELPPVLIIFSFLAGGTLFGVVGLLIAVPAAATIRLIAISWKSEI